MNIGDTVLKHRNAGFIADELFCVIPDVPENHNLEQCSVCDDETCRAFQTLWILDPETHTRIGECYHVSECQMTLETEVFRTEMNS